MCVCVYVCVNLSSVPLLFRVNLLSVPCVCTPVICSFARCTHCKDLFPVWLGPLVETILSLLDWVFPEPMTSVGPSAPLQTEAGCVCLRQLARAEYGAGYLSKREGV